MLLKDFYKIMSLDKNENQHQAIIVVNEKHEVFKGHFPPESHHARRLYDANHQRAH
jgi:3-hydroxymyristoyl/3-hydroxydecanoyl-(acyl carrier protein) dehydratase